ncbi:hypothetical protein RJ640_011162 [Escallonia rubra]|uniref:HMA domain-containing protein n=1 Tax=Escallonia rubra TaxID=112253 RepID=A0AA88RR12_9ASTE|nr:hypothetical protein RJ640_011162 [Escallonia rubra]
MVLKTVLRVDITCEKCKKKLLKAVSGLQGVDKIEIDGAKGTLTVTGEADPYEIIVRTKKAGKFVEVVSIGTPPAPPKKPDEKKPDEKKPPEQKKPYQIGQAHIHMPNYYCPVCDRMPMPMPVPVYMTRGEEPNPSCTIMICWRTLIARGKSSATHGFLCAIKGHYVSGGIRAAVAQGTVASAKRIVWDSLLRKTRANTKERINALEAQIQSMFKCDQDAPGILKQFSLRLDALEVNLEATDNARYAENMDWEGKFQELQDRVEHHTRHTEVDRLFFFMERLKPWSRTELNRRRVNNLNEAIIAVESLSDYNSEPQRPPQRGNPSRSNGGNKLGGQAPNQS